MTTAVLYDKLAAMTDRPPPFFVVGCDRSGTTVLRLMLDAHPNIGIPKESRWLAGDSLQTGKRLEGLLDRFSPMRLVFTERLNEVVEIVLADPRWKTWGVSDDDLFKAVWALADGAEPIELGRIVDAINRLGLEPDTPRWGDKNPPYVHEISRLGRLFPDAKFIHIIRDPRDVVDSLRRVGWRGRVPTKTAPYWRSCIINARSGAATLGPGRYMEISYESLVADPSGAVRQLCWFLNEPFNANMLDWWHDAEAKIADWERDGAHTAIARPPSSDDIGKWRSQLSNLDVAVVEHLVGDQMDALKIARRFSRWSPWLAAAWAGLALEPRVRPLLAPLRRG